jgi:2-(1,2-epoxy-1,2-dihydrophenyl)acetyl-CoA isomerase
MVGACARADHPAMTDVRMPAVLFERVGPVAVVTLNRPARLNAIDTELAEALSDALIQATATADVGALVLRGAGRAFCAGGDITAFDGVRPHAEVADRTMERFHPAILRLSDMPMPTLAAVHGAVAGAGLGLMLACDLVLAAEGTRMTFAYTAIGATPDAGTSWFLSRALGPHRAFALALRSGPLDAASAVDAGLVDEYLPAADFDAAVLERAAQLARGPTHALVATRRLLRKASEQGLSAHLDAERQILLRHAAGEDFAEGLAALRARRAPAFRGGPR